MLVNGVVERKPSYSTWGVYGCVRAVVLRRRLLVGAVRLTVTLTLTLTLTLTQVTADQYTVDLVPEEGTVTAVIAATKATDLAGNINTGSNTVEFVFDTTVPTLVLSSSEPSNTNEDPIPVTATFSEAVTGFVVGDVTVTGAEVDTFVAVSTSVYTMNVNPTGQGAIEVEHPNPHPHPHPHPHPNPDSAGSRLWASQAWGAAGLALCRFACCSSRCGFLPSSPCVFQPELALALTLTLVLTLTQEHSFSEIHRAFLSRSHPDEDEC